MKSLFALGGLGLASAGFPHLPGHEICRPADMTDPGGCKVDGSKCDGEQVVFKPWNLTISKWDQSSKSYSVEGIIGSHGRAGEQHTWQMYLHGPRLRPTERTSATGVPPTYMQATWTNKIYRFEDMEPTFGEPMTVTQKLVGYALAPSTSYPIEDEKTGKLKGLLVAEGQPFFVSVSENETEVYKGGVDYIGVEEENCTQIFPSVEDDLKFLPVGQVVNTVDCHKETGICFFTVWKFYDDAKPIFNNHTAPDCLHYCVLKDIHDARKGCKKGGIVRYENGDQVCHQDGVGAVHGMVVGHSTGTDTFDIFLVFTGKATFDKGESSMKKLSCEKTALGDFKVTKSVPFATELFEDTVVAPHDVGGDHAWPDDSGKYLWISTFRVKNVGVHMVDYVTGELIYSIHGTENFIEHNYAYSAGIHGVGELGKPGSYIGLATSACKYVDMCAPIPWTNATKGMEAIGVAYIIDIGSIHPPEPHVQPFSTR